MNEWIPVSERLPLNGEDILVYMNNAYESRIAAVNYNEGTWFDSIFGIELITAYVTHWMPLPEPPLANNGIESNE